MFALGKLPALGPGLKEQNTSAEIAAISDRLFRGQSHKGVVVGSLGALAEALHRGLPPDLEGKRQVADLGFIRPSFPIAISTMWSTAATAHRRAIDYSARSASPWKPGIRRAARFWKP